MLKSGCDPIGWGFFIVSKFDWGPTGSYVFMSKFVWDPIACGLFIDKSAWDPMGWELFERKFSKPSPAMTKLSKTSNLFDSQSSLFPFHAKTRSNTA